MILGRPRILHLGIDISAKRAAHRRPPFSSLGRPDRRTPASSMGSYAPVIHRHYRRAHKAWVDGISRPQNVGRPRLTLPPERAPQPSAGAAPGDAPQGKSPATCPAASVRPRRGSARTPAANAALICAGMSSGPSQVWRSQPIAGSSAGGTSRSSHASRSVRTSGSAFSWISRLADVCPHHQRQQPVARPRQPARHVARDLRQARPPRLDHEFGLHAPSSSIARPVSDRA